MFGSGTVRPTNWMGTISTERTTLEVLPRGAAALSEAGRARLDSSVGQMLDLAFAGRSLLVGPGQSQLGGNRINRAIDALCDRILEARRTRILRRYVTRDQLTRSVRGQLRFPPQAAASVQRPGQFACRWVELDEDVPENRYMKTALLQWRSRTTGGLRRRVDETLANLDHVQVASRPALEWSRIRWERLPPIYLDALGLARELAEGRGARLLAADVATQSEIVFMDRLWQAFAGRLTRLVADQAGLRSRFEEPGRHLATWLDGPQESKESVELLPDAEIVAPGSTAPLLLIDAKWKVLTPTTAGMGIDASDVHQMLAYAHGLDCRDGLLLYPWIGTTPPLQPASILRVGVGPESLRLRIAAIPLLWQTIAEPIAHVRSTIAPILPDAGSPPLALPPHTPQAVGAPKNA
jgi:5-methylcytosine-specific restriction enzyme subunit McrC